MVDTAADADSHEEDGVDEDQAEESMGLGIKIQRCWEIWKARLQHDYAVTAWALCVMPDVRRGVTEHLTGVQRDAMERVVRKLHESPGANKNTAIVGKSVDDIVDLFWDEFKAFRNKSAPFDKEAQRNSMHALSGKSHLWHEKYSLPYTIVLGFVGCRTTSNFWALGHVKGIGVMSRTSRLGKGPTCQERQWRSKPFSIHWH